MNKENVYVYLLSNLLIIIGEDAGKIIKNACKVFQTNQGPAISSLFLNITGPKELGMDIEKKGLSIVKVEKPSSTVADGYELFLSGARPAPESNIIKVPRFNKN